SSRLALTCRRDGHGWQPPLLADLCRPVLDERQDSIHLFGGQVLPGHHHFVGGDDLLRRLVLFGHLLAVIEPAITPFTAAALGYVAQERSTPGCVEPMTGGAFSLFPDALSAPEHLRISLSAGFSYHYDGGKGEKDDGDKRTTHDGSTWSQW